MADEINFAWINPDVLRPYDPRFRPLSNPPQDILDCPYYCIQINVEWWSHVEGVLNRLMENDAWVGDIDQKEHAVQQIQKLLEQTGADKMCNCGDNEPAQPPIYQIGSDGMLNQSTDGGEIWTPSTNDPRMTIIQSAPPVITSDNTDPKCTGAVSAIGEIQGYVNAIAAFVAVTGTFIALGTGILAILGVILLRPTEAYWLLPLVVETIFQLFGVTESDINDGYYAFQSDFQKILYCHMEDDVSYTLKDWREVMSDVERSIGNTPAGRTLKVILTVMGAQGLTNAARAYFDITGPSNGCAGYVCDDCEVTQDYTVINPGGFDASALPTVAFTGTWVDGSGVQNTVSAPAPNSNYKSSTVTLKVNNCDGLYLRLQWSANTARVAGTLQWAYVTDIHGNYVFDGGSYHNVGGSFQSGEKSSDEFIAPGNNIIAVRFSIDSDDSDTASFIKYVQFSSDPIP